MRGSLDASTKQLLGEWFRAVLQTPQTFRRIAFRRRTLAEELQEALLRGSLRKAFGGFDLLMLGLGIVIGSGWAQLSGYAAQQYAGPSVILSYVFAGLAALLAACCFAELCVEFPVAGGAFSYVMATFGELAAFITLGGLLLNYVVGMAAVARGFSKYLARLCNADPDLFVLELDAHGNHYFDFMAAGIVMLMSVLLSIGVRESAFAISSVTVVKLVLLVFMSIVGFVNGTWSNAEPFIDPNFGADGIFLGAAALFFTYVGFDAISNTAEEARNVAHLPWAIVGTPLVALAVYLMLSFALVTITVPSPKATASDGVQMYGGASWPDLFMCEPQLSFITAYVNIAGMKWMQYIISITALLGILTALTVGLFSISRIIMAASRDWLLPSFLARISPRTQTPLIAQMVFGVIIALLALFVEVTAATALVSFGALVALWVVCNAQMWRRYYPDVQMRFTRYGTVEASFHQSKSLSWMPTLGQRLSTGRRKVLVGVNMLAVNAVSIAFGAYYAASTKDSNMVPPVPVDCTPAQATEPAPNPSDSLSPDWGHNGLGTLWFVVAWALATLCFQLCCPLEYNPSGWHIPHWLMPWLPSAAICMVAFSVGALPNADYWKIGTFFAILLVVYLLYSLPMSYIKHNRDVHFSDTDGQLKVVELAFVDGKWQPARLSVFNPAPSGAGSVALSGPSTAATPHRSTELKASADGSYRGATDSAAGSGHLSPLRAAPSAARTVGRGVRVPHLPPMQEGNREG